MSPTQLTIGVPTTLGWIWLMGSHGLALLRSQDHRGASGAWAGALFPALLSAMYFATEPEVPVAVRNAILGMMGAACGLAVAIWLGYIVSDWRVNAQTVSRNDEGSAMSEPPVPPKPLNGGAINAPNNSGIIAPSNSGTINQIINPAAPRDGMKFYQGGAAVATVGPGQLTDDGRIVLSEIYNSGDLDFSKPVEFRNFVIRITKADRTKMTLMGFRNGGMVSNIIPDVEGMIVETR
jgi:hypothetical protein